MKILNKLFMTSQKAVANDIGFSWVKNYPGVTPTSVFPIDLLKVPYQYHNINIGTRNWNFQYFFVPLYLTFFRLIFDQVFIDFGSHLGLQNRAKIAPKSTKNPSKLTSKF